MTKTAIFANSRWRAAAILKIALSPYLSCESVADFCLHQYNYLCVSFVTMFLLYKHVCLTCGFNKLMMFERTVYRTRSVTKKNKKQKKTPHFRTYRLCDLPQTLIQRIVFPTGCTEKFGLIYRRAFSHQ